MDIRRHHEMTARVGKPVQHHKIMLSPINNQGLPVVCARAQIAEQAATCGLCLADIRITPGTPKAIHLASSAGALRDFAMTHSGSDDPLPSLETGSGCGCASDAFTRSFSSLLGLK